ncbi:hypothetical protein PR048_000304, partial [Dryococelus australis]
MRVIEMSIERRRNELAGETGDPRGNQGSIPGRVTGIVPDDAVGRRVFSGISRFLRPFIPTPLHIHFSHPHRLSRLRFLGEKPINPRWQVSITVKCSACLRVFSAFKALRGRGGLLAPHLGEPGSVPGRATPGFSRVGIVPDYAVDRRVFSGISRFSRPCIPTLFHAHLASLSSALKASMLRAAQISPCINLFRNQLKYKSLPARLHSAAYNQASDVCSLAAAPQNSQCYLTPHTWQYGVRYSFPCKSAIGSESSRACIINSDPIAKACRFHSFERRRELQTLGNADQEVLGTFDAVIPVACIVVCWARHPHAGAIRVFDPRRTPFRVLLRVRYAAGGFSRGAPVPLVPRFHRFSIQYQLLNLCTVVCSVTRASRSRRLAFTRARSHRAAKRFTSPGATGSCDVQPLCSSDGSCGCPACFISLPPDNRNLTGSEISRKDFKTRYSSKHCGSVQLCDWLKQVLVRPNCLHKNREGAASELRNPEWLVQMRERHQQPMKGRENGISAKNKPRRPGTSSDTIPTCVGKLKGSPAGHYITAPLGCYGDSFPASCVEEARTFQVRCEVQICIPHTAHERGKLHPRP